MAARTTSAARREHQAAPRPRTRGGCAPGANSGEQLRLAGPGAAAPATAADPSDGAATPSTPAPAAAGAGATSSSRPGGGLTFDDVVVGAWEGLSAHRTVSCPVCTGGLVPTRGFAGAGAVAGHCADCGSVLT